MPHKQQPPAECHAAPAHGNTRRQATDKPQTAPNACTQRLHGEKNNHIYSIAQERHPAAVHSNSAATTAAPGASWTSQSCRCSGTFDRNQYQYQPSVNSLRQCWRRPEATCLQRQGHGAGLAALALAPQPAHLTPGEAPTSTLMHGNMSQQWLPCSNAAAVMLPCMKAQCTDSPRT